VYAWQRFVDPETAAPFAHFAKGIENAEAIVAGEKPPETLGVRARSDHVLEVRFEAPFPHLEAYLASVWFAPVRRDVSERYGERYGSEADRMRYNGPYVIDEWKHDQRLRLRRNPEYWNPERVWLERIHWDYIASDPRTRANLFRDGQIAYTTLDASTLPDAVARGERIQRFRTGNIGLLLFNHADDRPTRSQALREALALAVDPREIAARIERMPGARPAASMFPSTLRDGGRPLHATIGVQAHRPDFDAAREAVQRARRELGGEPLPPLVLLLPPNSTRTAEHLQTRWAEILGLEVRVVPQAFKQLLAQAGSGDFDALLASWYGADFEPVSYMRPFDGTQPSGFSRYRSEAFDACFQRARRSLDPEARMEAYRCMHERIVEDRVVVPLVERASSYLVHPRLTGLRRSRAGLDPDLFQARILPPDAEE
jgi:oligopeptide transport system substrate-binding protein